MKIILTQEVSGLGTPGDIVEVKNGYGRNYLIPQGFAVAWSRGGEKQVDQIKSGRAARELATLEEAQSLKAKLEGSPVKLTVKAGREGRLFGSITPSEIVDAVKSAGGPMLDRRRLELPGHIKTTGAYNVQVKLHPEVTATFPVNVVAAK